MHGHTGGIGERQLRANCGRRHITVHVRFGFLRSRSSQSAPGPEHDVRIFDWQNALALFARSDGRRVERQSSTRLRLSATCRQSGMFIPIPRLDRNRTLDPVVVSVCQTSTPALRNPAVQRSASSFKLQISAVMRAYKAASTSPGKWLATWLRLSYLAAQDMPPRSAKRTAVDRWTIDRLPGPVRIHEKDNSNPPSWRQTSAATAARSCMPAERGRALRRGGPHRRGSYLWRPVH
ncbi:hypothetical protein ABIA27_001226 [Sinorhizobium fredii]